MTRDLSEELRTELVRVARENADLRAENARLREALCEIAGYDLPKYGHEVAREMRDEARAALEGKP